jgi:hypothetical protein
MDENLAKELEKVLDEGTEEEITAFLDAHQREFPLELQDALNIARMEDAIIKHEIQHLDFAAFQEKMISLMEALEKIPPEEK